MKYEGVINYTGNKAKLMEPLNELFEKSNATRLIDCCCGGLSVSLHSKFDTVVANDISTQLIDMYKFLASKDYETIKKYIDGMISSWDLSKENKHTYLVLRDRLNRMIQKPHIDRHLLLYMAHCYSFSNMIRFCDKGLFNVPFGQREFNKNTDKKLKQFYNIIETKSIQFENKPLHNLDIRDGDLVYIDPPYLITEAVYNKGWTQASDYIMMGWLDALDERGIDFVMSNVTHHRGKINQQLIDWSNKYSVISKDHKYVSNAYQAKDMDKKTVEVMITNIKGV